MAGLWCDQAGGLVFGAVSQMLSSPFANTEDHSVDAGQRNGERQHGGRLRASDVSSSWSSARVQNNSSPDLGHSVAREGNVELP